MKYKDLKPGDLAILTRRDGNYSAWLDLRNVEHSRSISITWLDLARGYPITSTYSSHREAEFMAVSWVLLRRGKVIDRSEKRTRGAT